MIRAAYRALMRHYHPDTNPDPDAQARAREITAAYAQLRDPAVRAEYDAQRAAGNAIWFEQDMPHPPPPPAMRGAGIAAALLSLALVGSLWAWPVNAPPAPSPASGPAAARQTAATPAPAHSGPVVPLEPESERLANLAETIAPRAPAIAEEAIPIIPDPSPADPVRIASDEPTRDIAGARAQPMPRPMVRRPASPAGTKAVAVRSATEYPKAAIAGSRLGDNCRIAGSPVETRLCSNDRLAALDRMSAGFFSQSIVHADAAKRELLLSSQGRFAARRSACHSDSCVAGTYLKHIREISAIMEGRAAPAQ